MDRYAYIKSKCIYKYFVAIVSEFNKTPTLKRGCLLYDTLYEQSMWNSNQSLACSLQPAPCNSIGKLGEFGAMEGEALMSFGS